MAMPEFKQLSYQQDTTLFSLAPKFRIVQLGKEDAIQRTDDLRVLKALIVASEDMYPRIGGWFEEKVLPGLRHSERIAYVAYEAETPIASAVLKLGSRSKFCHLKIREDFHDLDLGQMFFTQMTLEARHHAKEIHFTLPESLWCAKTHFFEAFGFTTPSTSHRQYRTGDAEFSCAAPLSVVWQAALEHLPNLMSKFSPAGLSLDNKILISIKPKYLERIFSGDKLIEVRKRFSRRWLGCRAVLYGTHPMSSLVGEATIAIISSGSPEHIWSVYGDRIGATWDEFGIYTGPCSEVSAIELTDVTPYVAPIGLAQLSHLTRSELRPPQSFCHLRPDRSNPWSTAVAVATLLHGRCSYLTAQ
jgi:predicted transcriptional regulator